MTQVKQKCSPAVASAVIAELGLEQIQADACGASAVTVNSWKNRGFPVYLEQLLRLKHPDLKGWKTGEMTCGKGATERLETVAKVGKKALAIDAQGQEAKEQGPAKETSRTEVPLKAVMKKLPGGRFEIQISIPLDGGSLA